MLRFEKRVAIVTGAGSGLGRSHSLLLAERGAAILAVGRPSSFDAVRHLCREIASSGGQAIPMSGTVGDESDAEKMVARALESFGRVDIVINNAGNARDQSLPSEAPGEPFERLFRAHVLGPMQLNRAAWPHMIRQHYGRILFTGSANATGWMKGRAGYEIDYAAAKAALVGVLRQTAGEGSQYNIKANLVMPWAFTEGVKSRIGQSPLGSWMQDNLSASSVSAAVALLVHDECPVTGEMISAQGGRVARVFFAATRGYYNDSLTPEDVQRNWDTVCGSVDQNGLLQDAFEQTQPREQRFITEMIGIKSLPALSWIASQPLSEMNLPASPD